MVFCCGLTLRWHPLFAFGLLALPLCGAAVTFFAAAKKVTKETASHRPRSHARWPCLPAVDGTRLSVALEGLTGLGSRTVRHIAPHHKLVQHQIAPARFAADGSIGFACASSSTVSLAYPTAARSAVPKLF